MNPVSKEQERLLTLASEMSKACVSCRLCARDCFFLGKYGLPGEQAKRLLHGPPEDLLSAFSCSLCGLCASVCPVELNPVELFLQMRRAAVSMGIGIQRKHRRVLKYEKTGMSERYSWYGLPQGCDTVFFPGCTFVGTRPARTLDVYAALRRMCPDLGIVLDCCAKPSHDLGMQGRFETAFDTLAVRFLENGIREVWVACPNCYKALSSRAETFSVRTVYEIFAEEVSMFSFFLEQEVTIHDPCPLRFEDSIHDAVRFLLDQTGISVAEMPHNRGTTICCGEGGTVMAVEPAVAGKWGTMRKAEAGNLPVITYCAGCAGMLSRHMKTVHLLDFLFAPEVAMAGKAPVSGPPFTYWNRLRIKKRLAGEMEWNHAGTR